VYTDEETWSALQSHPLFIQLADAVKLVNHKFDWPANIDRFGARYTALMQMFHTSVKFALEDNAILSALVADLVVARDFFSKVVSKIEAGHDAVFMLPLRSAAESISPFLDKQPGALPAMELFKLGYDHLHPLWTSCMWEASQYTKLPFSLLWDSGTGILAHSFSVTPIVFKPTEEMLRTEGVIDRQLPSMFKNPFWASDWIDAPVIGVEPLMCYYPPWGHHKASVEWVAEWSKCLHKSQYPLAKVPLYYPSKEMVRMSPKPEIVNAIIEQVPSETL